MHTFHLLFITDRDHKDKFHLAHFSLMLTAILFLTSCGKNPIGSDADQQAKLVFSMIDTLVGTPGLYTMNLDGSDLQAIATPGDSIILHNGSYHIVPEHAGFLNSRWSPDGTMIACGYEVAFDISTLLLMNADGTNKRILPLRSGSAYQPQWSPEGDRLLYMRGILGAVVAMGIIDTSGKNDHDFVISGGEPPHTPVIFKNDSIWIYSYASHDFQWGPTGSQIYATGIVNEKPDPSNPLADSPAKEIFRFSSDDGIILAQVTSNTIDEGGFRLSPNGQNVAFRRGNYVQTNRFFVLSLSGSKLMEILVENTITSFWNWSNDSKYIVFAQDESVDRYRHGDLHLYTLNIEQPNDITKLTPFIAKQPDIYIPKQ